jgi:hypothetical protein
MKNEKQIRIEKIVSKIDMRIMDLQSRIRKVDVEFADFYTTAISRAQYEKEILLKELQNS